MVVCGSYLYIVEYKAAGKYEMTQILKTEYQMLVLWMGYACYDLKEALV